jgi:hypothetical protein
MPLVKTAGIKKEDQFLISVILSNRHEKYRSLKPVITKNKKLILISFKIINYHHKKSRYHHKLFFNWCKHGSVTVMMTRSTELNIEG